MMRQTGVDGVTVARGAIGNPWIFRQARALAEGLPFPPPPSLFEQRDTILEHFQLAEQLHSAKQCGIMMRKFGIKYAASHPDYLSVREAFVRARNRQDWQAVLDQWYAEDLPGRHPDVAVHTRLTNCGDGGSG